MFALVGALMVALAGQRRWAAAAGLLVAALALPIGFGAWLMSQGLPPLPNSVLAKSDVYAGADGMLGPVFALVSNALLELLRHPRRWPYLALLVLLAALTLRAPPVQRWPLAGAVAALGLHALVGRFGWFFRYEIYALLFGALVLVVALASTSRIWRFAGARCCWPPLRRRPRRRCNRPARRRTSRTSNSRCTASSPTIGGRASR